MKKENEANAAQAKTKVVARKKGKKADAGLDDLLSAGLKKK